MAAMTDNPIKAKINNAYINSNIVYSSPFNHDIKHEWLSAMGMMETLIIMGVKAEIWEKWDEHHGR